MPDFTSAIGLDELRTVLTAAVCSILTTPFAVARTRILLDIGAEKGNASTAVLSRIRHVAQNEGPTVVGIPNVNPHPPEA